MKRITALLLTLLLLFSMSVTAFAAEDDKSIDVYARYEDRTEGIYRGDVTDGSATVTADGVVITVSDIPDTATVVEIFPIPASEQDALAWMGDKISEHGTLSHAYIIWLVDASGNKTIANGVSVTISCPHCSGDEIVIGLNTDGKTAPIDADNGGFTANGSAYYIVAEKKSTEPAPGGSTTVPVRGDENELHADVTVDGDTVELHELDFDEIDSIIGDTDKDGLIEIDLTELDDDVCKIILPVTSIEHIVNEAEETHNEHEALQVDFPHGSVKLDDKTMRAIVEQAECNEIILVLEDVGKTRLNAKQKTAVKDWNVYDGYEAYLFCAAGNKRISDFEGGVAKLSVPFEVPNGLKAEKFAVWYVADDGKTEKLETWYEGGKLCWSVDHFSDFIIAYEGEKTTDNTGGAQTGDNSMLWLWAALCVGSTGAIFFLLFRKREEKEKS